MKIYNTLTKQKEELVPIREDEVGIYVCGPTVYDFIHIGNARPMLVFDTLRRFLLSIGYRVNYVSNFTDVDDKIIKRANEEGKTAGEIAERFIAECRHDMEALNVMPATVHPQATKEIGGMIAMIGSLIEDGYAYAKNGSVYFRTRRFKEYGKLSKKNIEDLQAGQRIAVEEQKEDPMDFVLWKPKKDGEPFWESPWGQGRPGWHIECSVMAKEYLGETIDIHAGGEDLVFPHHENEIAQSECCNHTTFANYWMHNAFLTIDHVKMSKSKGNFFTVRGICEHYDPMVLRLFMLNAHYRSPLNYSTELLDATRQSFERIETARKNLLFLLDHVTETELTDAEAAALIETEAYVTGFGSALADDLNTADAIAYLFELVRFANTRANGDKSRAFLQALLDRMSAMTEVLGLRFAEEESLDAYVEDMIAKRQAARKERNFARADEIRDELAAAGIILEDTREGVKWKRATN